MGKLIVTTSWDDGSILDLKLAELLRKYNLKGTFYIPKAYLREALPEKEIAEIDREFEIGAHTLSHVDLTTTSPEKVREEVAGSKEYLENLLGHSISMFCYPMGRYSKDIKRVIHNAGFIAARTCDYKGFDLPEDPYEWGITLHASNGSPLKILRTWLKSGISAKSLFDWEIRVKLLFNLALKEGGIFHLWGHSWEIEEHYEWPKLERVLEYISGRKDVHYLNNGEIFERIKKCQSNNLKGQNKKKLG